MLAAKPENVAGAPCVKVIIDFTNEAQEVAVFEPDQLPASEGDGRGA